MRELGFRYVLLIICAMVILAVSAWAETPESQARSAQLIPSIGGSWLMPAIKLSSLVVIVGGGAFAVKNWMKRSGNRIDDAFRDGIIADAAQVLAQETGQSAESIKNALKDAIDSDRVSPMLDRLLRIEYAMTQLSPDECRRKVIVACMLTDGAQVNVSEIARSQRWLELPDAIRREFMAKGGADQHYVVFERCAKPSSERGDKADV